MLSPKKLLQNARNRIAKRENWGKGALAGAAKSVTTDDVLHVLPATDPDATCWCSLGALAAEAGFATASTGELNYYMESHPHFKDAVAALSEAMDEVRRGLGAVYVYNDQETHERVLDAFDRAIANTKGE